jgi:hypothetical protein
MEKLSNLVSSSYIESSIKNVSINSDITLDKIQELISSLENAAKSIIIPVLKIEKKMKYKLNNFSQNYKDIKEKAKNALNEIKLTEDDKTDTMNITDIQLNQKYAIDHEHLIKLYEEISNRIGLFINLFKSNEYNKLIKDFDSIIKDDEVFNKSDMDDIEKLDKENFKMKKKKTKRNQSSNNTNNNNKNKKIKKRLSLSKDKKISSSANRRKKLDKDLLEVLQNQFPTSSYVQKISKTFLRRRLNKKEIYKHEFKYKEDGSYEDERIRSSGESTVYKYGKMIFKFVNDDMSKIEQLEEFIIKYLKQAFIKKEIDDNIEIIAGKISLQLNDLLNTVFKKEILRTDFNVEKVELDFFEFYEELVSEFNPKESNVRIENCDDKMLKHLLDDWNMLKEVREFVDKCKKEGLR